MIAKMIPAGSHPINKYHRFLISKKKKRVEKKVRNHLWSSNPKNNKCIKLKDKLTIQEKRFLVVCRESINQLSKINVIAAINIEENLYHIDE